MWIPCFHSFNNSLGSISGCHRSIYKYLDTGLPSLSIDKMRAPQTHLSCPACITLTHARQPNLSSALLVLPAGLARMRHRENRRDREFMLGNFGTKLPARCILGRRGDFEGLANWLAMPPPCGSCSKTGSVTLIGQWFCAALACAVKRRFYLSLDSSRRRTRNWRSRLPP